MLNPLSSAISNNPYDRLIDAIIQIESEPLGALEQRRAELRGSKAILSDFDSQLSDFFSQLESFTDEFTSPFDGRQATVSDADALGATASESAAFGSYSLQVERLASADTRVSRQFDAAGTDLRSFFDANGAQSFTIEVASPTDADAKNRTSLSVTVDPAGSTNKDILDEIQTAITDAMTAAADDGTIKRTERANASVVRETSDTARLTLRSPNTGFNNRLSFGDSAAGLLALLDVGAAGVASGTSGGQVTAVGTSEADSELNSRFTLDGLTLYRDGNTVDDAVSGMTLTLKQPTDAATDFSVTPDGEGIQAQVEEFIAKYNTVLTTIKNRSAIDADAGVRGAFAGDSAITGLRAAMRTEMVQPVTSQPDGAPQSITDLGISIGNDGVLKLDDADKLLAAVEADPDAVRSLFAGTDGLATRLKERVDLFVQTGGILDSREASYDSQVQRATSRIDTFTERLAAREEQLREEYARLQENLTALQGQQSTLGGFF